MGDPVEVKGYPGTVHCPSDEDNSCVVDDIVDYIKIIYCM